MIDIPPMKSLIKGVPIYKSKPSEDPELDENKELLSMFTNSLEKDRKHFIDGLDNNKLSTNSNSNTVKYYAIYYRYLDSKTWNHSGLSTDAEKLRQAVESKPYVDLKSIKLKEVELPL